MTRKEAIEKLKVLLECTYIDSFEDEENEAIKMAIKALEQEPKTGHWIMKGRLQNIKTCSVCGYIIRHIECDNYCPNCMAKMIESEDH